MASRRLNRHHDDGDAQSFLPYRPQHVRAILLRHIPIQPDQRVPVAAALFERLRTVRGALHQYVPFAGPRLAELPDRDQAIRLDVVRHQYAAMRGIGVVTDEREVVRRTEGECFHRTRSLIPGERRQCISGHLLGDSKEAARAGWGVYPMRQE